LKIEEKTIVKNAYFFSPDAKVRVYITTLFFTTYFEELAKRNLKTGKYRNMKANCLTL
jgi:outer membrane receptor for ferric coprogen and ferric-rhodotorulic acid